MASRTPQTGLSELEASQRLAARGPSDDSASSRSYASIIRANTLTVFNLVLLTFGILTLIFGDWQDSLFLGIVVANAGIGTAQEIRAKHALDQLTALLAPTATVVRDGQERSIAVERVVVGDRVLLAPGDQVVADGVLDTADGLRLDESILTGETRAVPKGVRDEVRSASFVAEGAGAMIVTAVGQDSYAAHITGEAKEFRHRRSPLERSMDRLLLVIVAVMIPLGGMFGYALYKRHIPRHEAITTSVAGVVTLIPEGLVLLMGVTFAVAALRMTRRGVLAQQLNAVEAIASVDMICLDKTGTLTEPELRMVDVIGQDVTLLRGQLAAYAASATVRNATLEAIGAALPAPASVVDEQIPFNSHDKYSGLRIDGTGYVLGAPEHFELGADLGDRADAFAHQGRRVLAFGTAERLDDPRPRATGLVLLAEQLRPDAAQTIAFFRKQGVGVRVLSGDRPETVAAIARDAGITGPAIDARELPPHAGHLAQLVRDTAVFGRITPEGKKAVIEALTREGFTVAMVGDGVNDVPALKASAVAIAQGSGTQMARSVSDLVLVHGDFGALPQVVEEGRKVLRNVQRIAKLFVAKTVFAAFLILTIGLTATEYPLLPRQLTLAGLLTVGIPSAFLALGPSQGATQRFGFLRELASFAVPAGAAAGLGVDAGYLCALNVLHESLAVARTVATLILIVVGLFLILILEASGGGRSFWISVLCALLLICAIMAVALGGLRDFFALAVPGPLACISILLGSFASMAGLMLVDDRFIPVMRAPRPSR